MNRHASPTLPLPWPLTLLANAILKCILENCQRALASFEYFSRDAIISHALVRREREIGSQRRARRGSKAEYRDIHAALRRGVLAERTSSNIFEMLLPAQVALLT
eukprot:9021400-Pyramimonas_sp.AAC.1